MIFGLDRSLVLCATNILLGEELSANQKIITDFWKSQEPTSTDFSNHVFGGQNRIYIPLEKAHDDNTIPNDKVASHLSSHGYSIKDYKKGIAIDKYGRDIRIGKVLSITKSPADIVKAYTNDKSRTNSKHIDLMICISKHHHDVAGMSTGRNWTSCMNMVNGKFANSLEKSISAGSHVAYLIHSHDKDIKNPLARITLNPHHSLDGSHVILHPEETGYGMTNTDFGHTVRKWTQEKFPLKQAIYSKNKSVYNDDGNEYVVSRNPEHEKALLESTSSFHRGLLANSTDNKEHLEKLLHDSSPFVRMNMAGRGISHYNDVLVNDSDHRVRKIVAMTGNPTHLDKLVNDQHDEVRESVSEHDLPHHRSVILLDKNPQVRGNVARYGSDEDIDKLVHDPDPIVRRKVTFFAGKHHVEKLLNDPSPMVNLSARARMNANGDPIIEPKHWINVPTE